MCVYGMCVSLCMIFVHVVCVGMVCVLYVLYFVCVVSILWKVCILHKMCGGYTLFLLSMLYVVGGLW